MDTSTTARPIPVLTSAVTYSRTGTAIDVPGLSITLNTYGRPVFVGLTGGEISVSAGSNTASSTIEIYQDGVSVAASDIIITANGATGAAIAVPAAFSTLLTPSSGSHTYKIRVTPNAGQIDIVGAKLMVWET